MSLHRVTLGGAATEILVTNGRTLCNSRVETEWVDIAEPMWQDLRRRLSARDCRIAQWNLQCLLVRVLLGSGGVEHGVGAPEQVVFSVALGWIEEMIPALVDQPDRCRPVPPDLPDIERHVQRLAMDERAVLHRRKSCVRLFAGQAIIPASTQPIGYVAIEPVRWRISARARQLAYDLGQLMEEHGAVRLLAASPVPVRLS